MSDWRVIHGLCPEALAALPDGSFDAVICDPPYPEISRPYGRMTEAAWTEMMHAVVRECRRLLKPKGSAVFVLQPNSKKVGSMRAWLWEFMAWCCREWNQVQDAWWWNYTALPHTKAFPGLLRKSVKPCVWLGEPDCFRNADAVLWSESDANRALRESGRCTNRLHSRVSGVTVRDERARLACVKAGGVMPFNLLPIGADGKDGKHKHPGRTPLALCDWWTRYIVPPGGAVLDPFAGSGTVGLAALKHGCSFVGVEKMPEYVEIATRRLREVEAQAPLFK